MKRITFCLKTVSLIAASLMCGAVFLIPTLAAAQTVPPAVTNDCTSRNGTVIIGTTGPGAPQGTAFQCLANSTITGGEAGQAGSTNIIVQNYDANGTLLGGGGGVTVGQGGTTVSNCTNGNCQSTQNNCSILSATSFFQNCIWFPLMAWLGSWFLALGAFFLWVSGGLFDLLVENFIIQFGYTLSSSSSTVGGSVMDAVNTGWSVFRDVSNIVIIGLFVFIAINMILGSQQYGAKKLVAHVIIIAVLLNFSLLFTKMIVDASNFTAYQFYKASANAPRAASCGQSGGASVNGSFDIAGTFLCSMGIHSVWKDTYQITERAGQSAGDTSGWAAFFYGVIGFVLLTGIAVVLFYGSWQIVARAITIIFLMLTAAIAFASYLIPKIADGHFGWRAWWTSLLNATAFAPLLMVFLFVSLQIINRVPIPSDSNGLGSGVTEFLKASSGSAAAAPAFASTWNAIFSYLIVVGLLYASIKVSSKLASGVGNAVVGSVAGLAGMAVGAMVGGPIGLGVGIANAKRGVKEAGGVNNYVSGYVSKKATQIGTALANTQYNPLKAPALNPAVQSANRQGNLGIPQQFTSSRGVKRVGGGVAPRTQRPALQPQPALAAAKGAAQQQQTTPTPEQLEAARVASENVKLMRKDQMLRKEQNALSVRAEANRAAADAQSKKEKSGTDSEAYGDRLVAEARKQPANAELLKRIDDAVRDRDTSRNDWKDGLQKGLAEAVRQAGQISDDQRKGFEQRLGEINDKTSADTMKNLQKEIVEAVKDPALRTTVQAQIETSEGARESEMRHQEARIRDAREHVIDRAKNDAGVALSGGAELDKLKHDMEISSAETDKAIKTAGELDQKAKDAEKEFSDFKLQVDREAQEAANAVLSSVSGVRNAAQQAATVAKAAAEAAGTPDRTPPAAPAAVRAPSPPANEDSNVIPVDFVSRRRVRSKFVPPQENTPPQEIPDNAAQATSTNHNIPPTT